MNASNCGKYSCLLFCEEKLTCNHENFLDYPPCPPPLNYPYTGGYYKSFMIEEAHLEEEVAETVMRRCSLRWTYPVETTTTQWSTATTLSPDTSSLTSSPPPSTSRSYTTQSELSSTSAVKPTTTPKLGPAVTPGPLVTSNASTIAGVLIAVAVVVVLATIGGSYVAYRRRKKKQDHRQLYSQFSYASTVSGGSVSIHQVGNAKCITSESKQFLRTISSNTEQEGLSEVDSKAYLNEAYAYENTLSEFDKFNLNQTSPYKEKFKDTVQAQLNPSETPGIIKKETEVETFQSTKLSETTIPATKVNVKATIVDVQMDCPEDLSEKTKEKLDGYDELKDDTEQDRKFQNTECVQVKTEIQDLCQAQGDEKLTNEKQLVFINEIHVSV